MSSVFAALGIDADDVRWQDLALCDGYDHKRWYEKYESSPRVAKNTDAQCFSCPVQYACLKSGIENNEWGCWGGVFLVNGKIDQAKNSHKTPEDWEKIRDLLNG